MEFRKRERLLVFIATVCIGAFVGNKLIASPLYSVWKSRGERIVELKRKLSDGEVLLDREDSLKQRWTDMQSRVLPVDVSAAEQLVLQAVSRWTQASRLGVNSLKPRWIEEEDNPYKTIECRVAAEGSMAALARFVYELEGDPLALRLEEVEINSRDDGGQKLSLSIRFTGLVLIGEEQ